MQIRQANKDEVKKLQELNDKAFADNPNYDTDLELGWGMSEHGKKYFTEVINNPENCCFVAEDNGELIGYITGIPKDFDYRKSKYIEINNLGVIAEYRRQGIGHKLIEACLTWAKEKGYQRAFLVSFSKNEEAITFYKNNGFAEIYMSLEKDI